MEEKEPIKIKLSTVLLIIAVIVIILMGVFIGFLYKRNIENIKSEDNTVKTENIEKTFSESEVKEVLQNYLNIGGAYQGEPYGVLYVMKTMTGKNVINDEYPEAIEDGEVSILPTNIKYSEFKEFMLNYMTEEVFNTDFARGYVDKDGMLYCKNYGASGLAYEVISIEKMNDSNTKYKGNLYWYVTEEYKEKENITFEVANKNNKCVISSITFPDAGQEDVKENDDKKTNTSNANTSSSKVTSENNSDTTKNKIIGIWKADKVVDSTGNDLGLSAVWGTGISYSNKMEFKENNVLLYEIGITASSDDGKYTINGNTVKYGIPTDVKGNYDWHTAVYIEEEDIIKEEIDVVGEKAIVTYIRASKNENNKTDKYKEITKKLDLNDENFEEIFVVTDVEKNNGKYTLKGRVYTKYKLTKSEYNAAKNTGKIIINGKEYKVKKQNGDDDDVLRLYSQNKQSLQYIIKKDDGEYVLESETQQGNCYKATNNYKKITVEENTKCLHTNYNGSIDEEEVIEDTTVKEYFKNFKSITENTESGELLPNYNFEFKNGKCTKITIKTIFI